MPDPRHSKQAIADGIHAAIAYTYADATARTSATGFVSADLGKLAWQQDDDTVWMLIATTPTWKSVSGAAGAYLVHKAGKVLVGAFAGNPKTATVTFSAAFSDANYGVTLTAVTTNAKQFIPVVESQLAGSFIINLGTNGTTDLVQVNWVAVKDGESS